MEKEKQVVGIEKRGIKSESVVNEEDINESTILLIISYLPFFTYENTGQINFLKF